MLRHKAAPQQELIAKLSPNTEIPRHNCFHDHRIPTHCYVNASYRLSISIRLGLLTTALSRRCTALEGCAPPGEDPWCQVGSS